MNKERKLIIAGNWKMNKTVAESLALVKGLRIELANVKEDVYKRQALQDALKTLESSGAEMAALHLIHQQQQVFFIAQLAQAQQVFGLSLIHI